MVITSTPTSNRIGDKYFCSLICPPASGAGVGSPKGRRRVASGSFFLETCCAARRSTTRPPDPGRRRASGGQLLVKARTCGFSFHQKNTRKVSWLAYTTTSSPITLATNQGDHINRRREMYPFVYCMATAAA